MKSGHLIPRFHGGKSHCAARNTARLLIFLIQIKNKLYWAWGFLEYTGLPDALWSLAFCTRAYVAGTVPFDAHVGRGVGTPQKCQHFWEGAAQKEGEEKPRPTSCCYQAFHLPRADGGRFSDPPPDSGVPLGRRSCVDSGDGRGWGSAGRCTPPGGGGGSSSPGAGLTGEDPQGAGRFSPRLSRGPGLWGRGRRRGDPPAHPSRPIPPRASPALRAGCCGAPSPPRSPRAGGTSLAPYLPGRACGRPAAGVAGTGRRLPGLEIRTQRISSQSWTGRRSGRASLLPLRRVLLMRTSRRRWTRRASLPAADPAYITNL